MEAAGVVHDAISAYLAESEIAVAWTLTIDVAGPDGSRYLAHRAGGGIDGRDAPMVWAALGMLRAAMKVAENQLAACTSDAADDDGE
jgi:hypothetical protein